MKDICGWAALYSIGALESEEESEFEQHLTGCYVCKESVREYQQATVTLATWVATPPPQGLWRKIQNRLSNQPAALVRRNDGHWVDTGHKGITAKQLFVDASTGAVTSLIRMVPGAVYPAHSHSGLEYSYVLEGDLKFAEHTLLAGDFEVASADSTHSPVTTSGGCLLLITNHLGDELLA